MPVQIAVRTASDGYRLAYRHFQPDGVPRGWLVMLHGIQSHSGWYGFTQQGLLNAGWDVRFPDRRGSGQNQAQRGHAPHWQRLIGDVVHFLNDARVDREKANPSAPVILAGLSWGGKLAYAVRKLRPDLIDGLVLLYPGIVTQIGPNAWQRLKLALARRLAIHDRRISLPLDDPQLFTADPQWQAFIRDDPCAIREVTSGFLLADQDLQRVCYRADLSGSPLPVLLMLAGEDRIIHNGRVHELLRQAEEALEVVEYPQARHTLEFEACREHYLQNLIEWLSHRRGH